ncbi:MAG: efflux RND transporter periplasmic adaptor subunit [Terrimicrobiaceae bacterium]
MKITKALASVILLTLISTGCGKGDKAPGKVGISVTVVNPRETDVTDHIDFTGTVGAVQSVNIVARVEGFLEGIFFKDGSYVTKGTPLLKIQQAEYIDQLKIYQAQLDYDTAEYNRQVVMYKQNSTSEASVQKYLSEMQQAQAQVALAKLNLAYTTMDAPFDGLLGEHQVDIGNLVGNNPGNPTLLVNIEQIVPIYVNFSINTRDALRLRQLMKAHDMADKSAVGKNPVFAQLEDETGFPHEGILDFSDNSVDTSTGTIQLRGIFPNEDRTLFPGLFAAVRIPIGAPKPGLVVPESAVLSDQEGDYVFVVDAKNTIERRSVVKGPLNGVDRAITSGVTAADRVVVGGIPNISVGQTVQATLQSSPAK